jgi:hypothetical protein
MRAPDADAALCATLRAVAVEIRALAARAEGLQGPIARLAAHAGPAAVAACPELQSVDLLTQELRNLGAFTARLAADLADFGAADPQRAAEGLELSALASRLGGAPAASIPASLPGDCAFFGD